MLLTGVHRRPRISAASLEALLLDPQHRPRVVACVQPDRECAGTSVTEPTWTLGIAPFEDPLLIRCDGSARSRGARGYAVCTDPDTERPGDPELPGGGCQCPTCSPDQTGRHNTVAPAIHEPSDHATHCARG